MTKVNIITFNPPLNIENKGTDQTNMINYFHRTELKKRHIEWQFKVPRIEILSDYDVNGQVLILPITGNGKANVTLSKYLYLLFQLIKAYEEHLGEIECFNGPSFDVRGESSYSSQIASHYKTAH